MTHCGDKLVVGDTPQTLPCGERTVRRMHTTLQQYSVNYSFTVYCVYYLHPILLEGGVKFCDVPPCTNLLQQQVIHPILVQCTWVWPLPLIGCARR